MDDKQYEPQRFPPMKLHVLAWHILMLDFYTLVDGKQERGVQHDDHGASCEPYGDTSSCRKEACQD